MIHWDLKEANIFVHFIGQSLEDICDDYIKEEFSNESLMYVRIGDFG